MRVGVLEWNIWHGAEL